MKTQIQVEEEGFQFLMDKIRRNRGVDFKLYREGTLKRRVISRLKSVGCFDYSDYIFYLNRDPEEYDRLLANITIHVTEFFRDPETFELLREKVIPEILRMKDRSGRRILRIWSVGTSNGEEAYSLAILFHEGIQQMGKDFHVRIYGTDIDVESIEKARKGIYSGVSLKNISKDLEQKYFTFRDGLYEVRPEIKELVRFQIHNFISDSPLPYMDLVLCRNVLIYFSRPLQETAYATFAKVLNQGGFLVLGKVESLWGYSSSNFKTVNSTERVYQKLVPKSWVTAKGGDFYAGK